MSSFRVEVKRFDHWNPNPEARIRGQIRDYETGVARQGGRIVLSQTNQLSTEYSDAQLRPGQNLAPPPGDHGMSLETVYRTYRAAQLPVVTELPIAEQVPAMTLEPREIDFIRAA